MNCLSNCTVLWSEVLTRTTFYPIQTPRLGICLSKNHELKGTLNKDALLALSTGMESKIGLQQFLTQKI